MREQPSSGGGSGVTPARGVAGRPVELRRRAVRERPTRRQLTRHDIRRLVLLATGVEAPGGLVAALLEASRGHVEPAVALLRNLVAAERSGPAPSEHLFRREGEYWTIRYQGQVVRLRHAKGLLYLERLLREPGRHVHVTELAGQRDGDTASLERARLAVTKAMKIALARIDAAHSGLGRHLGATVRRGYYCVYLPDPQTPIAWAE
jgi:hypothetical protein